MKFVNTIVCVSFLFFQMPQAMAKPAQAPSKAAAIAAMNYKKALKQNTLYSDFNGTFTKADVQFLQSNFPMKDLKSAIVMNDSGALMVKAGGREVKMEIVDGKRGLFKIDGHPWHLNFMYSAQDNIAALQAIVGKHGKSAALNFMIPEAHAFFWIILGVIYFTGAFVTKGLCEADAIATGKPLYQYVIVCPAEAALWPVGAAIDGTLAIVNAIKGNPDDHTLAVKDFKCPWENNGVMELTSANGNKLSFSENPPGTFHMTTKTQDGKDLEVKLDDQMQITEAFQEQVPLKVSGDTVSAYQGALDYWKICQDKDRVAQIRGGAGTTPDNATAPTEQAQ